MGSFKILPPEVKELVKAYASDKVGIHPTATLVHQLIVRQSKPHEFYYDDLPSTVVHCPSHAYFMNIHPPSHSTWRYRRYMHTDFDERHHPQHFDISLRWDNMREQDEIEAMGAEDCQRPGNFFSHPQLPP